MYWMRWRLRHPTDPWSLWHEVRWDGKRTHCKMPLPTYLHSSERSNTPPKAGHCARCGRLRGEYDSMMTGTYQGPPR